MHRTTPSQPPDLFDRDDAPATVEPLDVDQWLAASLLQKSIRRGLPDLAARAAITLWRHRGLRVWHRLAVIAVEDVGIGAVDTIGETVRVARAMTRSAGKRSTADPIAALVRVVRALAVAVKDRSTDYLASVAIHDASLAWFRTECLRLPPAERVAAAVAPDLSLSLQAVAAWTASGFGVDGAVRLDAGDRAGFFRALLDVGVPRDLVTSSADAATMTRQPICLMLPLVWAAWRREGRSTRVIADPTLDTPSIRDVPAWAFCKFTRAGKAAISRFAVENDEVRAVLRDFVEERRAKEAAAMAAFYLDAALTDRRLDWPRSRELEREGRRVDMATVGVPRDGVEPILDVMRANYDHLNALRAETWRAAMSPKGARG